MTPRPPWSKRQDSKSVEEFYILREGVPDSLRSSLFEVFREYFVVGYEVIGDRLQHLERLTDRSLPHERRALLETVWNDRELLLDAIDHALRYPTSYTPSYHLHQTVVDLATRVKRSLDDARSVYDIVRVDELGFELAWRQPPELATILEEVASDRSRAADHLQRAWSDAFARQPKPTNACFEAAKAVEAAARATIEPNNQKATLGTMLRAMEAKPEKWTTSFPSDAASLETVMAMMRMIWKGHLRHGNPDEPLDVSPETCEMIIHTAAVLVHWFTSGKIQAA